MKPTSIMIIAGDPSGDILAAELVHALREELAGREGAPSCDAQPLHASLAPRFFGAGGPRLAAAGVEMHLDLAKHSVTGLWEVAENYLKFRRFFFALVAIAIRRKPDLILCVDFGTFNLPFARAIRRYSRRHGGWFQNWNPKIVQFVSPQVWASREGRAWKIARNCDLLLSIFPFEKAWYASRVPQLKVEFVGHPMVGRFAALPAPAPAPPSSPTALRLLLLPGSRVGELKRHLPVMIRALALMRASQPALQATMVLPNVSLADQARTLGLPSYLSVQVATLSQALQQTDVAIASTGTVTMECAWFGVPTVTLYKTSWSTYHIAKFFVKVRWLTMPDIMANEELFPEFLQDAATPQNLASAALELLQNPARRQAIRDKLKRLVASLGAPGAPARAAHALADLLHPQDTFLLPPSSKIAHTKD